MTRQPNLYKKFVRIYLALMLVLLAPFLLSYLFLTRAGELLTYADAAEVQQKTDAIYGTALAQNYYQYKLDLVRQRRPDVLVIGSSRAMQFRQEFFNAKFVSAGGAMRAVNEGHQFITDMLKFHKPKLVIISLDIWWFNADWQHTQTISSNKGNEITYDKLTRPYLWLKEKKINPVMVWEVIRGYRRNPVTTHDNLGIMGLTLSEGFRKDGSRLPALAAFDYKDDIYRFDDVRFEQSLEYIQNRSVRFVGGSNLAMERLGMLDAMISLLRQNGIQAIVFLSPVAPRLVDAMADAGDDYAYVARLRQYVKTGMPVESYDFFDPAVLGSGDCEFIDGYHPGDVTSARILLAIMERNPDSALHRYADMQNLAAMVDRHRGKVLIKANASRYKLPETDFLEFGCPK